MREKLTVALVGCGQWGRFILRDLVSLGCKVVVVARSAESQRRAIEGGAAVIVDSIAALPAVDGAVVATTTSTHGVVVESLLDRHVPIFVEKPLTADRPSAMRLAERAPDHLFVMDKWRYHPGVEMLAEIARSGELGPVLGLRTMRVGWGNPHPDVDGVWILAPHDLAIALEILGMIPSPESAIVDRVGDIAAGLIGILGGDPWFVCEVSTRYREHYREIRLHCHDGIAVLPDSFSDHIQIMRNGRFNNNTPPDPELRPVATELPLLRELRVFVEYLDGGPPPRSSAAEGAAIVSAIADLRALAGLDPTAAC